jgi:hypothetical protein
MFMRSHSTMSLQISSVAADGGTGTARSAIPGDFCREEQDLSVSAIGSADERT